MNAELKELIYNMYDPMSECDIQVHLTMSDIDGSKISYKMDGTEVYSLVIAKSMALQKSDDELIGHAGAKFITDEENWKDTELCKKMIQSFKHHKIITKVYVYEIVQNGVTFKITSTSFYGTDSYELKFENSINSDVITAVCQASSEAELLDNLSAYSHAMETASRFFKTSGGQKLTIKAPSHRMVM